MEKTESDVIELLVYLQEMVESSPKMPITGKTIIDKKEFNEVIDQIIHYLPEQIKRVREAKMRASEIIALAQRDAKAIRLGSREYSNEILTQLDAEIEKQREQLIKCMQESFEKAAKEIDTNLTLTGETIKGNIAELRMM